MTLEPNVSSTLAAISLSFLAFIVAPGCTATASVTGHGAPALLARPLDEATEQFVSSILSNMTLEEKIAQMIQGDIASVQPEDLATYKLGSILAGGGAAPGGNVRSKPQAWLDLTDRFYRASLAAPAKGHPPIPVVFGIDAVHGDAKLIGATVFPHNVGLGAAHDAGLMREIGKATAEEVSAAGIDWTFAPTVAVARDVRWGRSYESYSESPELVAEYAPAMVEGLQGMLGGKDFMTPGHTLSSVKHFLGDGGTHDGRDQGDTRVSESELLSVHGAGYVSALKAGALIVMASYNSWNGVKMHANHHLLTDVLKGRLGFEGFVVGDWNAHEQVPGCSKEDCPAAILAGLDMLMAPDSWKKLYENTLAAAHSGAIPAARIDDAVRRILRVKAIAGMFQRPPPKERRNVGDFSVLGSGAHRALARRAVRESLVLMKNSGHTLPLDTHAHLLVCGGLADDIGAQAGGWTIDWQGDHNHNEDFPGGTSIYAGIKAALAAGGSAELSRDGSYKVKPDAAVVVFGERPYAEFEGDLETLEYSPGDKRDLALFKKLRAAKIPTVAVFLSGRPRWVNPELNAADAFVAAWLPGSEGEGVADVLFGSAAGKPVDFTGRLSFSWPATAMPVLFAADGSVKNALYPRDFGLSYRDPGAPFVKLSEDPGVPKQWEVSASSLFARSHPIAPWSLFLADGADQVHLTLEDQASPHGIVTAGMDEAGRQFAWNGASAGSVRLSGRASDLTAAAARGESIEVRYRVTQIPDRTVLLKLLCTEGKCGTALDVAASLREPGEWRTLSVPLSCFAVPGSDLREVEVPFALETDGHLRLTIADIDLEPAREHAYRSCPPAID
ncbi:MAG TPA: glycoside hydrolase family 3 N-terminal domain-containing protein [Steroidobacteraceae bacterium]|jgi:beta-glucosidase